MVDKALERLSQAAPQIKKNVINACVLTIAADGILTENEGELLRAISDSLDCPMPPLVSQA
jgi:tellurite resistance protein